MIKGSIQEEDITIVNFYAPNIVSKFAQSCPTLCNSMDCSLPGSSVHGIFQARVLEWVAISFSKKRVRRVKKAKDEAKQKKKK